MKILLLTDVPPSEKFSGSLLTKHLCELLPSNSIVCFSVLNPQLSFLKETSAHADFELAFCEKPNESHLRLDFLTYLKEKYTTTFTVPKLVKEAASFAKKHNVDRIWAILQGQTMIRMSVKLAKELQLPLYTQVWDHPAWWVKANKLDPWSKKEILQKFDEAISVSQCCAVASYEMQKDFVARYGVEAVPIIASMDENYIQPIEKEYLADKKEIVIGMAGQLYASTEWQALLTTLDNMDWRIDDKNIKICYFGYSISLGGHKKACIEYRGYRSQDETIKLLSECDILYCPYFFDKEYEIIAKTSFPSKLTTYLAAGKPVLFHGPEYASPAIFLRDNEAGIVCTSLVPNEIAQAIRYIVDNNEKCRQVAEAGQKVLRHHLTMTALKRNFMDFIGSEHSK